MRKLNQLQRVFLLLNTLIICVVFVLNYFYLSDNYNFTLKCICSTGFAVIGVLNLVYAIKTAQSNRMFYIGMTVGLVLAMLGDVTINSRFILGAALFALGHVFFVVGYCFLQRVKWAEIVVGMTIFAASALFMWFSPILVFEVEILRYVCIGYALIISLMLGKAFVNFWRERNIFYGMIAVASALFFLSDLMLLLDWFCGRWVWTGYLCMAVYYPGLCMLAFSMLYKAVSEQTR